jgi:hypothetical protein
MKWEIYPNVTYIFWLFIQRKQLEHTRSYISTQMKGPKSLHKSSDLRSKPRVASRLCSVDQLRGCWWRKEYRGMFISCSSSTLDSMERFRGHFVEIYFGRRTRWQRYDGNWMQTRDGDGRHALVLRLVGILSKVDVRSHHEPIVAVSKGMSTRIDRSQWIRQRTFWLFDEPRMEVGDCRLSAVFCLVTAHTWILDRKASSSGV